MNQKSMDQKNLIAQWAFDTRPILGRFHLWLEDVQVEWLRGKPSKNAIKNISFVDGGMERLLITMMAVTAIGTRLFGRYGDGKGLSKKEINEVKKDADAISAYVMSEGLWYLSRSLPENHAIMISLGEGLMPKVGETPEMGSNPQLGFGRVYARPQVAKWLDQKVQKLLNQPGYEWDNFYQDVKSAGITIWGAAVDTLENTSRFALGEETGPLSVFHLFDQPLSIARPYEGYMGNLVLPKDVVRKAEEFSLLVNFYTPREKILEVILATYPDIKPENIHVWTLGGKSREKRIGRLWQEWQQLGVHLVEDGWKLPNDHEVFIDSGTYTPNFAVGTWQDEEQQTHLFICDGYAASAEAMQAASLSPLLDLDVSLAVFTSKFELSYEREGKIMQLDPDSENFRQELAEIFQEQLPEDKVQLYRSAILEAQQAGIPLDKKAIKADDFFPEKKWRVMGLCGYMLPDPYTGAEEVKKIAENTYQATVRLLTGKGDKIVKITLRKEEGTEGNKLFNPLLTRFMSGEEYQTRPVKISDSGRIRNELQTLCSEALEHFGENGIRVVFSKIPEEVIPRHKQQRLKEVLQWYRHNHPIWFRWLEVKD